MIKKMLWGFSLLAVSVFAISLTGHHKAAAAFFTNYCDVLASPGSPGGGTAANCQNGQNNDGLTGLNTSSQAGLKKSFIDKINTYGSSGYGFQRIGAAYIKAHLQQLGGNWEDNVNNPAVTLTINSVPNAYACENTAFFVPASQVVSTSDCAFGASSLLFWEGGRLVYIIKIDCGNPLGNLSGPSAFNPNSPPSGAFTSVTCSGMTYTFRASFSDPDGPTNAFLRTNGGAALTGRDGSPNAVWSFSVKSLPASFWPIKLYVADAGGAGDRLVDFTGRPNCPPIGDINSATCNSLSGWAFDPNDTSSPVTMYYSVYTPGGTLIENRGGGNAKTDVLRADVNRAFGITGVHGFNISPLNDLARDFGGWQPVVIKVYAGDRQDPSIRQLIGSPTIQPCRTTKCTSNTFSGNVGVGTPNTFTVTLGVANVNNPAGAVSGPGTYGFQPAATDNLGVTVKNSANIAVYNNPDVGYTYGYPNITSNPITWTATGPGTYTMSYSYPYRVSAAGCGDTATAAYQPFFSVLGGDAAAGPGYGSPCTEDVTAGIKGWNTGTAGGYFGSGSQLGALALGQLTTFASAQGSVFGALAPTGLSFANTNPKAPASVNAGAGLYGGGFDYAGWCVDDYAGKAKANTAGAIDYNSAGARTYTLNGDQTLAGATLGKGAQVTLKVNGDVYITNNITYAAYTTLADMPQFQLLVTGNIYINGSVSELHGFYDAQPSGAAGSGYVHTCATGLRALTTDYATCNNQLTFYGSVSAAHLALERAYGNLAAVNGVPAEPAEKFVFTPELWMANIATPSTSNGAGAWQSVTSLPPVL